MDIAQNTPFDPTTKLSGQFNWYGGDGTNLIVINESNQNIFLGFSGGQKSYVPANDRRRYFLTGIMAQVQGTATWTTQTNITNANSINQVVVEVYEPGENVPETYPSPLIRQTNLGSGLTNVIASAVVNDNNAAGFELVEGQVTGDGVGSAVILTNDGNLALGNALRTGSIDMPGGGAIVGTIQSNLYKLLNGSLTRLVFFGPYASNTVNTVYNHNLGAIPDMILTQTNGGVSTTRSVNVNFANFTTTTFEATCNISGFTFFGMAIAK